MKELDNNQMARLADYINGKPVQLTDEELQMLAEDDDLAAQVMEIAQISQEAEASMGKAKGRTIRMIVMAAAACLVMGLAMGLIFQNGTGRRATGTSSLMASQEVSKGYTNIPKEFESLIQSASTKGAFDFPPDQPFDITLSRSFDNDTLVLCNTEAKQLIKTRVNGNLASIEGLASGLYYYYLIYNPTEKGALSIGVDEQL